MDYIEIIEEMIENAAIVGEFELEFESDNGKKYIACYNKSISSLVKFESHDTIFYASFDNLYINNIDDEPIEYNDRPTFNSDIQDLIEGIISYDELIEHVFNQDDCYYYELNESYDVA